MHNFLCNQYKIVCIKKEPKVMEQIENSQQYQRMLCQQLSFAINRLIIENRTIIRNVVLQKLSQIIKCDDKLFIKTYEKLLSYNEQQGQQQLFPINKNTKLMATKYLSYFIQKNLLVLHYQVSEESQPYHKIYQSSGLTLQINSWINTFSRVFDLNPSDDFEPYKNSVIEIYVKMFLYSNLYSVESIKKLMNTIKYYFKKQRSQISLNLIQKIIENPKLLKKRRNKNKAKDIYKKKFTKPDILWQIMTLLIEDLSNHFEIINQNDHIFEQQMQIRRRGEKIEKQMVNSMQLLTQIICELQMDDFMDQICRDKNFITIFKYFLAQYKQFQQLANQQFRSILVNCMAILGQKIAQYCTKQIKMCPEEEIFQVILRLGQIFWNLHIQGEFKHPKQYFNQSVTNFLLAIIQMGEIGSILEDGRKTASFKGNYYYLINKFLQPICYSFQQLFFQSYKSMENSRAFICAIKDLVYQMRIEQNQNLDCLAYLQEFEQPSLYQHTRILYKLSQSFMEIRSMIKKIVNKYISAQVFTGIYDHESAMLGDIQINQFLGMEQMSHSNLIFGLILNCMFSNILCRSEDWLILMQNLPYKVLEMLVKPIRQKSNQNEILRFLYLINFRLYMDDILNEQISDGGAIKQMVKILTSLQQIKEKSNSQVLLYIDIVEYYYTHFNYTYESQKEIIHNILQTDPIKYILGLQLLILEKYQQNIQISLINKYLIKISNNLKEDKMNKELACKTTIRIINIVRASFLNKSERDNMKIKFLQIYSLNQTVCNTFIKLKSHIQKPKTGICTTLPQLINYLIRNQNWKQSYSLILTRQYLQFIHVLHQTYKDKIETYFDMYSSFEAMLFQITAEKARDLDVHLLKQIEEEPKLQNFCVDLKHQIELYYIYTFCTLLCEQKYFIKYKIYEDMLEMNPLRSLAHKSAVYLLDYKCRNVQYSVIFILILHQIITKAPQFIDQSSIELILHVVFRQANRKNKLLITDTAYLFRGKIYILFVLIIKCKPRCVADYFNKLLYKQVDSNALSGRNDQKIQNLFIEVFCTARNYAPHYDLPFLISNLISLLEFLGIESNKNNLIEGLNIHSKYIHFYIKLLLEASERLFKYETMKSAQADEETKLQEYIDQDEQIQIQLESKYKNVVWITTQRVNLEGKNKSNKEVLEIFVKFYQNLKVIKEKWLDNVQKRLMEINTMKNINKIMEVYGNQEKKKRKIYTLIHQ